VSTERPVFSLDNFPRERGVGVCDVLGHPADDLSSLFQCQFDLGVSLVVVQAILESHRELGSFSRWKPHEVVQNVCCHAGLSHTLKASGYPTLGLE
jgi:hypothetical protein